MQGHRFSRLFKMDCAEMYSTIGLKAYNALREMFIILPCPSTIRSEMSRTPTDPGISPTIHKFLKNRAQKLTAKQKLVGIGWDEMDLTPRVEYDRGRDRIVGIEDYGDDGSTKNADHALVFFLRGLETPWKVPLSYSLSHSAADAITLQRLIVQHIKLVEDCGYTVLCEYMSLLVLLLIRK